MDTRLRHELQLMGILHLWSASGFNVTFIVGLVDRLLQRVHFLVFSLKTVLLLLSVLAVWWVGVGSVSLTRALFAALLLLLSVRLFFRKPSGLFSLLAVVSLLVISQPDLLESWSLRFSVLAVFGIHCFQPLFRLLVLHLLTFLQPARVLHPVSFYSRACTLFAQLLLHFYRNLTLFLSLQLALVPLISQTWGEIALNSLVVNTVLAGFTPTLAGFSLAWIAWCLLANCLLAGGLMPATQLQPFFRVPALFCTLPLRFLLWAAASISRLNLPVFLVPEFTWQQTICWILSIYLIRCWATSRLNQRKMKPFQVVQLFTTRKPMPSFTSR